MDMYESPDKGFTSSPNNNNKCNVVVKTLPVVASEVSKKK